MAVDSGSVDSALGGLTKTFDEWFVKKAPFQIPANIKEILVKISPWGTLVVLVLTIGPVLALIGLGALFGALAPVAGVSLGLLYWLSIAVLVLQEVLMAISIPGLMKRKLSGWKLAYYVTLVNVVYGVVNFILYHFYIGSLISTAVSAVVALYILFQIRSYYH